MPYAHFAYYFSILMPYAEFTNTFLLNLEGFHVLESPLICVCIYIMKL
jgi:hypothetical protein